MLDPDFKFPGVYSRYFALKHSVSDCFRHKTSEVSICRHLIKTDCAIIVEDIPRAIDNLVLVRKVFLGYHQNSH